MNSEKTILPQFPLSIVAFPGEVVNLHIFEPRYVQLINECKNTGMTFGIPPFNNGEMSFFGTEMKLTDLSKVYPDGKMDIRTKGMRVYQVHKFEKQFKDRLYAAAEVTFLNDEPEFELKLKSQILDLMTELFEMLQIKKSLEKLATDFGSYAIGHHVGLSQDEKIRLLTIRSENQRLEYILNHLKDFVPSVKKAETLKKRAAMNGHFRSLQSPDF